MGVSVIVGVRVGVEVKVGSGVSVGKEVVGIAVRVCAIPVATASSTDGDKQAGIIKRTDNTTNSVINLVLIIALSHPEGQSLVTTYCPP